MRGGKSHEAAGLLNENCQHGMFAGSAGGGLSFVRGNEIMNVNMDSSGKLDSIVASDGPGKGAAIMQGENLSRLDRGIGNFLIGVAGMGPASRDGTLAEDVGLVAEMQVGAKMEASAPPGRRATLNAAMQ